MPTTVIPPSPPSRPRLSLAPTRGRTVLDGGWWPRSWDPVAELPGLVLALTERHGRIRHIMLNIHTWDSRIRRLAVGPDVVRIGWFDTLDPALLVATTGRDVQVDLLVVPPGTTPEAAERAMATAADPTNLRHAPDILTTGPTPHATTTTSSDAYAVWDNEGGSPASDGIHRGHAESTTRPRTGVPA
ncbi:DUF5994 family protein [Micromonospora sp. NBC_00898]|uniref:DUF5994 family protein n=1 Tax=Micromonospora sp. NBC_00898 TaxID=2975981 RepID=UPI00386649DA|nr:DUF5994 family protein [Micromonospora sp. NBC_00898]